MCPLSDAPSSKCEHFIAIANDILHSSMIQKAYVSVQSTDAILKIQQYIFFFKFTPVSYHEDFITL